MKQNSFSVTQLEYFASLKTKVSILPNFKDSAIYLMSMKVGPFNANQEATVPFWLAVMLKEKNKCKILAPFWLVETELTQFIEREKKNVDELISLQNDQFFQISYTFLNRAANDIQNASKIRSLVQSLQDIRRQKMRRLLQNSRGNMKLVNWTTFEANRLKQSMGHLNEIVQRLKK